MPISEETARKIQEALSIKLVFYNLVPTFLSLSSDSLDISLRKIKDVEFFDLDDYSAYN